MKLEQTAWTQKRGWIPNTPGKLGASAQLVFAFGNPAALRSLELMQKVRHAYSQAILVGCSTAGEIYDTQVFDDSLVITALHFAATQVRSVAVQINEANSSYQCGKHLAESLDHAGLAHVIVLSEGLNINGSDLVDGLTKHLPDDITVTGGLSGDGSRFGETLVVWNNQVTSGLIVAIGLYGQRLRVGYGTLGGWDSFGPDRLITRSKGNMLYELDGTSALALYKRYLGDVANNLPASGLLFPLSLATALGEPRVVRTLLGIDEKEQSIRFAGDVPEGTYARLMKANFDRLIDGAVGAALASTYSIGERNAEFALLISCVGRKLVLQQRIEEEVEGVRDVLGPNTTLAGFYSYGEISPLLSSTTCALHNQTMTITTFAES